jgi:hypothetical protein
MNDIDGGQSASTTPLENNFQGNINGFIPSMLRGDDRSIAVMIDNEGPAVPRHSGFDKAYIVYEAPVESGDTRLMAIFKGVDVSRIGPVRSSRHYFVYYAMEYDPIYVHYGWSPLAQQEIARLGVNNINGIRGVDGNAYWRGPTTRRHDYHNAFTSIEKIKKMIKTKKYRETSNQSVFTYNTSDVDLTSGSSAQNVSIPYSSYRNIKYQYDQSKKVYYRFIGDSPQIDAVSKNQYSAKNLIIEFVKVYALNDGTKANRKQIDVVGTGKGYFLTNGKYIDITWQKDTPTAKTIYKDNGGNEITLNNGQTWIQIVPGDKSVSIN